MGYQTIEVRKLTPAIGAEISGVDLSAPIPEEQLAEMMRGVLELLDPSHHLLILNAYSLGFSALITQNLLSPYSNQQKSQMDYGELYVSSASGICLPLGVWGSLEKNN